MESIEKVVEGRHPGTQTAVVWFAFEHLAQADLRIVSKHCRDLAVKMIQTLCDGPELTTGLRKLREAKDCFVTQRVMDHHAPKE